MVIRFLMVLMFFFLISNSAIAALKPDDRAALAGLKTAKVIFDVRVADLDKLIFNLRLFKETFDGMVAQGVKPKMVIAFRGPGVNLLVPSALDDESLELVRSLKVKGVRLEACALALRVFKGNAAAVIPEIDVVGNVINSFIGYQNKGYAMVAIN